MSSSSPSQNAPADSSPLRIGLAGLGTVGTGVVEILTTHKDKLRARTGRAIEITAIAVRDPSKPRDVVLDGVPFVATDALAHRTDVDLVVELIGGSEGPALDLARATLRAGKGFITANKALIAHHGTELATLTEAHQAPLAFEASVAGGIPILKALREGLAANGIQQVSGIMNGTCNYILTKMEATGADFDSVLKEAQELGYAEADPTFDVDGIDTAHKLAIVASLAFGTEVNFNAVEVEGIRHVTALDIEQASQLGYRIKLLGVARQVGDAIEQWVEPTMVPLSDPLSSVSDVYNAVVVEGDFVGKSVYEGRGAGAGPTASAVVADIMDVARAADAPAFGIAASALKPFKVAPADQQPCKFYLRLPVQDRVGVLADVSAILRDHKVSIASLIQRDRSSDQPVQVVLVTHKVVEQNVLAALKAVSALEDVVSPPHLIRIENN